MPAIFSYEQFNCLKTVVGSRKQLFWAKIAGFCYQGSIHCLSIQILFHLATVCYVNYCYCQIYELLKTIFIKAFCDSFSLLFFLYFFPFEFILSYFLSSVVPNKDFMYFDFLFYFFLSFYVFCLCPLYMQFLTT